MGTSAERTIFFVVTGQYSSCTMDRLNYSMVLVADFPGCLTKIRRRRFTTKTPIASAPRSPAALRIADVKRFSLVWMRRGATRSTTAVIANASVAQRRRASVTACSPTTPARGDRSEQEEHSSEEEPAQDREECSRQDERWPNQASVFSHGRTRAVFGLLVPISHRTSDYPLAQPFNTRRSQHVRQSVAM